MKKIILTLLMGASIFGYAQEQQIKQVAELDGGGVSIAPPGPILYCISGGDIEKGQTASFTYAWGDAQCNECYDWDINNDPNSTQNSTVGNITIVSSDMGKTVLIRGNSNGPFSLNLTYFDETGCHTCTFNGNVKTTPPPPNCCSPVLEGGFECRGSKTGGWLNIKNNNSNCNVEWTNFSKINIQLNGAVFIAGGGDSKILYPSDLTSVPEVGLGFSVIDPVLGCFHGNQFDAVVTFYYKNGCQPVQKRITFTDIGTPKLQQNNLRKINEKNQIIVSPNPTSSIIKFEGADLSKYKISIIDGNGIEIIQNRNINGEINIQDQKAGIYFYKIRDENGFIQQGKIIKQ